MSPKTLIPLKVSPLATAVWLHAQTRSAEAETASSNVMLVPAAEWFAAIAKLPNYSIPIRSKFKYAGFQRCFVIRKGSTAEIHAPHNLRV